MSNNLPRHTVYYCPLCLYGYRGDTPFALGPPYCLRCVFVGRCFDFAHGTPEEIDNFIKEKQLIVEQV